MAEEVQDFYERYPYPRPIEGLESYARLWDDPNRRRADYHLFWPDKAYRENYSILVAGCGTSQAAKHASRWPSAQVTGIDFSAASIHHTGQLKQKYNLRNLQLRQLAVEHVEELETSFDQIVCTGVLHHLPDPDAGLAALRSVLKPDGAMHLMVYAPYGRTGIYMLQEFCRRVGIPATDEGIRDLVTRSNPCRPIIHWRACYARRRTFDMRRRWRMRCCTLRIVPIPSHSCSRFYRDAGLTFGRWVKQAPYSVACGVLARNCPQQAAQMAALSACRQFRRSRAFSRDHVAP